MLVLGSGRRWQPFFAFTSPACSAGPCSANPAALWLPRPAAGRALCEGLLPSLVPALLGALCYAPAFQVRERAAQGLLLLVRERPHSLWHAQPHSWLLPARLPAAASLCAL